MKEDKYHDLDKQITQQVRAEMLAAGITAYPRKCDYCDEDGRVEMDNNGPIGPCPLCNGAKQYMASV